MRGRYDRDRQKVYFIRPIGMAGPVKIGCSMSPDRRRETLETWSPFPLEIIAEIDGGFELERRFHAYFADTYQGREWFKWSELLGAVIAAIKSGTFDPFTLPKPQRLGAQYLTRRPWTDEQRARASYSHRIRFAEKRLGQRFGIFIQHVQFNHTWRDHIPAMEAFIAQTDTRTQDPRAARIGTRTSPPRPAPFVIAP